MKKMFASIKFQVGFTLIELLIAVAIIVILISIGAVSYTTVNRNARDAQRKSDLKKIQLALEQFYADHGSYPAEHGEDYLSCSTIYDSTDLPLPFFKFGQDPFGPCSGVTYMAKLPNDPLGGSARYYYEPIESGWRGKAVLGYDGCDAGEECQHYTLWAVLENKSDPDISTASEPICKFSVGGAGDPTHDDGRANYYDITKLTTTSVNYCLHSPN